MINQHRPAVKFLHSKVRRFAQLSAQTLNVNARFISQQFLRVGTIANISGLRVEQKLATHTVSAIVHMVIDIYIQSQIPMEILYVNASHTNGSAHAQEKLQ